MKFEKIIHAEINQILHLQPDGWPSIVSKFEFYTTSNHCYPVKLIIDDAIVGIGATIVHDNAAWLAHIIVHPDYRNKGLGKIITEKLISQAKEKNCQTISLIATELGAYVYEKIGFTTETTYLFYKVAINKKKYNSDYIQPYTTNLKQQILDLDKEISKENRIKTIETHLKNASVYIKNGKVEGFLMPSLGEGLILASNNLAGIELIKYRLNTNENVIFPANNTAAKEYIEKLQVKVFYKAKRMKLGADKNVVFSNIFARIGGYLG